MGDRDHRGDHRGVVGVGRGAPHERQVDLQRVDRQPPEVGERGEPGPEPVDGQVDPEVAERPQGADGPVDVLHRVALGNLEVQRVGLEPARGEGLLHVGDEVGLLKLVRGHVHHHAKLPRAASLPLPRLPARGLERPRPQG